MKTQILGLCLVLGSLSPFAHAGAPATTVRNEYDLLRRMPGQMLARLQLGGRPDARGYVGRNNGGWLGAGNQRGGCWYVISAVIADDLAAADDGWRAVDAAFALQQPDGAFPDTPIPEARHKDPRTMRVQSTFFFIQELAHAILVIQQSPHAAHFAARIEAVKPKMRRACEYIDGGFDRILANSSEAVNRLFIAAKALGLAGAILEEPAFVASSRRLVGIALKLRDDGGVFIEHGGRDSSYNAVSVFFGLTLALHVDFPEIVQACGPAMEWQLSRVLPSGAISVEGNSRTGVGLETYMGLPKGVNFREVIMAFVLHGMISENPAMLDAAQRVMAYAKASAH